MANHDGKTARGAARISLLGALVAAVAASSCCVLPVLMAVVGLSGAGLAAAIAPFRLVLLAGTGLLLAAAIYFAYRRPAMGSSGRSGSPENAGCVCDTPLTRRTGRAALWATAGLVVVVSAYPYVSAATSTTESHGDAVGIAELKDLEIGVTGMTCEGCTAKITNTLAEVPGVARVRVSFARATASVSYDPSRVTVATLIAQINRLDGYTGRVRGQ